jgi:hypothetical protein
MDRGLVRVSGMGTRIVARLAVSGDGVRQVAGTTR